MDEQKASVLNAMKSSLVGILYLVKDNDCKERDKIASDKISTFIKMVYKRIYRKLRI